MTMMAFMPILAFATRHKSWLCRFATICAVVFWIIGAWALLPAAVGMFSRCGDVSVSNSGSTDYCAWASTQTHWKCGVHAIDFRTYAAARCVMHHTGWNSDRSQMITTSDELLCSALSVCTCGNGNEEERDDATPLDDKDDIFAF